MTDVGPDLNPVIVTFFRGNSDPTFTLSSLMRLFIHAFYGVTRFFLTREMIIKGQF